MVCSRINADVCVEASTRTYASRMLDRPRDADRHYQNQTAFKDFGIWLAAIM